VPPAERDLLLRVPRLLHDPDLQTDAGLKLQTLAQTGSGFGFERIRVTVHCRVPEKMLHHILDSVLCRTRWRH
jgi:hypothetical protein